MSSLEGESTDDGIFDKLVKPDVGLTNEVILTVASGLYRLIQLAIRFSESSLKPEVNVNDITNSLYKYQLLNDAVAILNVSFFAWLCL